MTAGEDRYAGKPMLRILEMYALDVIGHLQPRQADAARQIVQRVWGGADDWRATVRQVLAWPAAIDENIRDNWRRFQDAAAATGDPAAYGPHGFAAAFADEFAGG